MTAIKCHQCGRPSYLWGGISCDKCDADSDGVIDATQPLGTGPTRPTDTLFPADERGWELVRGSVVTRFRPNYAEKGWEIVGTIRKVNLRMLSEMERLRLIMMRVRANESQLRIMCGEV